VEDFFCTQRWMTVSDCVLRPLVSEKTLGDANDEGEFILIPKSAPPDPSHRIRACETERDHASRQASDLKCNDAGGYWSVARGFCYFRPRGRRGYSQSCSTSFAGNCPPPPTRTETRHVVRNYCQTGGRDRDLWRAER